MMKKVFSVLAAFTVTSLVLWFLLTPDVITALKTAVTHVNPWALGGGVLLCILAQWFKAWRFAVMVNGTLQPPARAMVRIAFQLNMMNFILPMRMGELTFPVLMRHVYGASLIQATGVLLLARLFDLLATATILLGAAAFMGVPASIPRFLVGLAAVGALLAPAIILLCGHGVRPLLERLTGGQPLIAKFMAALDGLKTIKSSGATILIGGMVWLTLALIAVIVAASVTTTMTWPVALMCSAACSVAFALPITGVAGVGPSQAAWVWMATTMGIPFEEAVTSALILHMIVLVASLLSGAIATAFSGKLFALSQQERIHHA